MAVIIALALGLVARLIGLPPLVGVLAAGFVLNGFGFSPGEYLELIADLGVYLLLFGIGQKLDLRSPPVPQIWGTASLHMLISIAVLGTGLLGLGAVGLEAFAGVNLQVAFALSFSSTVFAVKVLEEKGRVAGPAQSQRDRHPDHAGPLRGDLHDGLGGYAAFAVGPRPVRAPGRALGPELVRPSRTRLVLLAMVSHEANLLAVKRLPGPATAQFDDELEELRAAGAGFAEHRLAAGGSPGRPRKSGAFHVERLNLVVAVCY